MAEKVWNCDPWEAKLEGTAYGRLHELKRQYADWIVRMQSRLDCIEQELARREVAVIPKGNPCRD
jgi:hypothetical protein